MLRMPAKYRREPPPGVCAGPGRRSRLPLYIRVAPPLLYVTAAPPCHTLREHSRSSRDLLRTSCRRHLQDGGEPDPSHNPIEGWDDHAMPVPAVAWQSRRFAAVLRSCPAIPPPALRDRTTFRPPSFSN